MLFGPLGGGAQIAEGLVHQVAQARQVFHAPVGVAQRQLHPLDRPFRFRRIIARAAHHQFVALGSFVDAERGVETEDFLAQPLGHLLPGNRLAVFDHADPREQLRKQGYEHQPVLGHAIQA